MTTTGAEPYIIRPYEARPFYGDLACFEGTPAVAVRSPGISGNPGLRRDRVFGLRGRLLPFFLCRLFRSLYE